MQGTSTYFQVPVVSPRYYYQPSTNRYLGTYYQQPTQQALATSSDVLEYRTQQASLYQIQIYEQQQEFLPVVGGPTTYGSSQRFHFFVDDLILYQYYWRPTQAPQATTRSSTYYLIVLRQIQYQYVQVPVYTQYVLQSTGSGNVLHVRSITTVVPRNSYMQVRYRLHSVPSSTVPYTQRYYVVDLHVGTGTCMQAY